MKKHIKIKKMMMTFVILFSIINFILFYYYNNNFPTKTIVDEKLKSIQLEKDVNKKYGVLSELLKDLSDPMRSEDDEVISYAIQQLIEIYVNTDDEVILMAIDNTEIDGGFANYVCGFYSSIKHKPIFIERYKKGKNIRYIKRCIGMSIDRKDIERIEAVTKKTK